MRRVRSALSSVRVRPILPIALFLAGAAAALVQAATADSASSWRDRDIRIDGSDEEWRGQETPVKGQRFSLGIVNDGEWLYLCLPTKDASAKAMIASAVLVVWLDPQGGKKQRFGIHFPVPNPPNASPRREPPPRPPQDENPPTEGQPPQVRGQDEVGILGPGGRDAQLVPIESAGGIEGRVGVHGDLMVVELKLPLTHSDAHPFAPNVAPGQTMRLQIETAPLRGNVMALPPTVGGPSGPPRPWGGGWGIVIGGGGHGKPVLAEPFDVTMNVQLAKEPAGK